MAVENDITLDRSSPVPLYFQVAEQLEGAILDGRLSPGDRVANEVSMAQQLGLSRPTMRQAIQVLVDKGLLVRKRGVGTQVVHGQIRRSIELTSLFDDLVQAGQAPTTQILSLKRVTAPSEARERLGLTDDQDAWDVRRLRFSAGEPLALLRNIVPTSLVDLSAAELENGGLYEVLRNAGIHLRVANQEIGARRATREEAHLLGEREGAPLLTMQRTAYNDKGEPVEYGCHVYRPEHYTFQLTLVDR